LKNKEELPQNSNRGPVPRRSQRGSAATAGVFRQKPTGSARRDQPALNPSEESNLEASGLLVPEHTDLDLMEQIVSNYSLDRAWRRVKRNRGAPGPDGITIAEFEPWAQTHWPAVRQQLLDGTYRPQPVRRKVLKKENGGERLLGIPNVLDRLIQQAVLQILTPIFDPEFSESSFGFRPGRSAHGAAKQVQQTIRQGNLHVVNLDLSKFFDRVNHDVLINRVARKVRDQRVLKLIGRFMRAGVMTEGVVQPTEHGAPQGGPLSPMLSNIFCSMTWTRNWNAAA
jgi:RNA-directed DNA polymerase